MKRTIPWWIELTFFATAWVTCLSAAHAQYPRVYGVYMGTGRTTSLPPGPGSWAYYHDYEIRSTVLLGRTPGGAFVNVRGYEYVDYGRSRKDYAEYKHQQRVNEYWNSRRTRNGKRYHGPHFRYHKGNSP